MSDKPTHYAQSELGATTHTEGHVEHPKAPEAPAPQAEPESAPEPSDTAEPEPEPKPEAKAAKTAKPKKGKKI